MIMKYVQHLKYPEWGIGRILFEENGKADVQFRNRSIRLLVTDLQNVDKPTVTEVQNTGLKVQTEIMLDIFRESRGESPTRTELMQLGFGNPNAVIKNLRDQGYTIETIAMSKGSCKYRLVQ